MFQVPAHECVGHEDTRPWPPRCYLGPPEVVQDRACLLLLVDAQVPTAAPRCAWLAGKAAPPRRTCPAHDRGVLGCRAGGLHQDVEALTAVLGYAETAGRAVLPRHSVPDPVGMR